LIVLERPRGVTFLINGTLSYFLLHFSRKMAVFALFCVVQSGADAQQGSPRLYSRRGTHTSPPHIQILCNAQVAYRMVPRDARSDDDVFYLFLQKQKIGAKLHMYL
jgi:hypothetical protein